MKKLLCILLSLVILDSFAACGTIEELPSIEEVEVGGVITFGTYEQDRDEENGPEKIEWIVLDKQDDKILVVSKYALDCKPYNDPSFGTTSDHWKDSTLREWLDDYFFSSAFDEGQQGCILTTSVDGYSEKFFTIEATEDKVFLLSNDQAIRYFDSDEARACKPTEYAKKRGAYVDSNGNCWYWTHHAYVRSGLKCIDSDGSVASRGTSSSNDNGTVRPAMWIDLSALAE